MTPPSAVATLVALTPAAKLALGGGDEVLIGNYPFKVGRESRSSNPPRTLITELRLSVEPPLNDVYLLEPRWSDLFYISREHFTIEQLGSRWFLVDRGSVCGTLVAGRLIGGDRAGGRTELRPGDVIVVGGVGSEYAFRFEIAADIENRS